MDTVPNPAHIPMCLGAPADLQAQCGQPGPHGPHPLGQLLPEMFPPEMFPAADNRLPGCPDFCLYDHRTDDERDDLVLHHGDDHTDDTVRQLLDPHALDIRVARTDCPPEGRTGTPVLAVRMDLELTSWRQAAELAHAILDGFGYLHGADQ